MDPERLEPWGSFESGSDVPDAVANDPEVMSWWTEQHDSLIRQAKDRDGWYWILNSDEVAAITPPAVLAHWRTAHERRPQAHGSHRRAGFSAVPQAVGGFADPRPTAPGIWRVGGVRVGETVKGRSFDYAVAT